MAKHAPAGDSGDASFIPGSGRSPGGRNGNPFEYSCLENSIDRGAWRATVQGVSVSDVTGHMHTQPSRDTEISTPTCLKTSELHRFCTKNMDLTFTSCLSPKFLWLLSHVSLFRLEKKGLYLRFLFGRCGLGPFLKTKIVKLENHPFL